MLSQKYKWQCEDKGDNLKYNENPKDRDEFYSGIALEPQRIRTFSITYDYAKGPLLGQKKKQKL